MFIQRASCVGGLACYHRNEMLVMRAYLPDMPSACTFSCSSQLYLLAAHWSLPTWHGNVAGQDLTGSLEDKAALPAPGTGAVFPRLIGLIHIWIKTAYMKKLIANERLWFCFSNLYLTFWSMKLTLWPTNEVNTLRLSKIRNSHIGLVFGCPTLNFKWLGNANSDNGTEHSTIEGPK